jgi:hypothetical protein
MSRALFLAKLTEGLAGLPQPEIAEIVSDYEFHFAEATAAGQSENDVVASLGDPARLARELRGEMEQHHASESTAMPPAPQAAKVRLGTALVLGVLIVICAVAAYEFAGRGERSAPAAATPPAPPARGALAIGPKITISGGQVVDLGTITQDRIEILLDGGGHATARGRVKELTLHVDGSGDASLGALQADIVHVDVSGTGGAEVSATQLVDATISGPGTIRLKEKPKTLKQSVTGSGMVILPN